MKLILIFLEDSVAAPDQIVDALPANSPLLRDLTQRQIKIYRLPIYTALMLRQQFSIKIIVCSYNLSITLPTFAILLQIGAGVKCFFFTT